jgi:hypothetical protein
MVLFIFMIWMYKKHSYVFIYNLDHINSISLFWFKCAKIITLFPFRGWQMHYLSSYKSELYGFENLYHLNCMLSIFHMYGVWIDPLFFPLSLFTLMSKSFWVEINFIEGWMITLSLIMLCERCVPHSERNITCALENFLLLIQWILSLLFLQLSMCEID